MFDSGASLIKVAQTHLTTRAIIEVVNARLLVLKIWISRQLAPD